MSTWIPICAVADIPSLGARVVKSSCGDIAVFRNADDEIFALRDKCPHKGGPLSQGIVFGRKVACPLHGWNICLDDGNAVAPDKGCAETFPVEVRQGRVFVQARPQATASSAATQDPHVPL
jgi:nitrite reductase (NADH) small subunit